MLPKKHVTSDAVEILHHLFIGDDPQRLLELDEARIESEVARLAYDLREKAGMTQARIAKRVGVPATAIDQLENGDYSGNPVALLRRIAAVLGREVEIQVVPAKRIQRVVAPKRGRRTA